MSAYPKIRGQRLTEWDEESPFVCIIWERPGRGGKPISVNGFIKTFETLSSAEVFGREYIGGRVTA